MVHGDPSFISQLVDLIMNIDILCAQVVLVVVCEWDHCLVNGEEGGGCSGCHIRLGMVVLCNVLVAYSVFFVLRIKSVRSSGCLLYSLYFWEEDLVH